MLTWNVYISNFNQKRIETHNIFNHYGFIEDCKKIYKKYKDDKENFLEQVRKSLMYYYWSKCEWEIILSHWPPRENAHDEKIDVYDQVMLNWPQFSEYIWNNKEEFKSTRKKK